MQFISVGCITKSENFLFTYTKYTKVLVTAQAE